MPDVKFIGPAFRSTVTLPEPTDPMHVQCPHCWAPPNSPCTYPDFESGQRGKVHQAREAALDGIRWYLKALSYRGSGVSTQGLSFSEYHSNAAGAGEFVWALVDERRRISAAAGATPEP